MQQRNASSRSRKAPVTIHVVFTSTMPRSSKLAFNVVMNWAATGVGLLIPFFLTPFVVRSLGSDAYGVWILSASTVSYLNLLDLGMRSAVIRFVSKAKTEGAFKEVHDVVGAALWFRLLIALAVAGISIVLAISFPHLFKIPSALYRSSQITVLLCALGVAITLITGVFGAVLAAINRFDRLSTISMGQTIGRAAGVLFLLKTGHGLISLACWELAVVAICGSIVTVSALKLVPACRGRIQKPQMDLLRKIWSYSFVTFIWIIAVQVIINSDNLMVGHFVSVRLAAFYAIGGSLVTYSGQIVSALTTTFTPLASSLEAAGKIKELRNLLIRGTQATLVLSLPISLALLFRGRTFIGLWMGPSYMQVSGRILQILLIAQFMSVAVATAGSVMMAIGKHIGPAKFAVAEAILNVTLTLILCRWFGAYGVAWGTSIAVTLVTLAFWPSYIKRTLDIPISTYLTHGWGKAALSAVPYGIVCYFADRAWHPRSLILFFIQILITLPVYAVSLALVFPGDVRILYGKLLSRWVTRRSETIV